MAFPAVMFMLALPALGREQVPVFVWVSFAVDGLVALLLLALLVYAGPLLVMHDLSIRDALRNGLILSARYPMNTLGIMGMVVIFVFATIRVHSLLIFLWPALWGLFVVNNCRMVVSQELAQNAD